MLTSFPISRKKTLGRSFQNVFGSRGEESSLPQQQQHQQQGLFSVTLPDSINSLDQVSPTLYAWLNQGEYACKSLLRIYSPSGELITDPLPDHLTKRPPPLPPSERHASSEEQMFNVAPINSVARESLRKQTRKPVPNPFLQPKEKSIKRFFLNVMELELKGVKLDEVVCLASLAGQKRTTSWLPLYPSSKQSHAYAMESFLFDIPQSHGDLVISILVYSKQKTMQVSPSVSSLTSNSSRGSFFTLKRRGTLSSSLAMHAQHSPDYTSSRQIANPSEIGSFLDEITLTIPSSSVFGKVQSWHSLKTHGRVQLEMGMLMDKEYKKVPQVPPGMTSNIDYINFYLLTPGGLIWDKKYVVANVDGLFVYSSEHWDSKSAHAWIPFRQVVRVDKAQREFMPCLYTLQVSIALPWKDDTTVFNPTPFSSLWKDMVVEAGVTEHFVVKIYLAADSEERMERWKEFLECHIERHHPK